VLDSKHSNLDFFKARILPHPYTKLSDFIPPAQLPDTHPYIFEDKADETSENAGHFAKKCISVFSSFARATAGITSSVTEVLEFWKEYPDKREVEDQGATR
jgi:hypothetical protein